MTVRLVYTISVSVSSSSSGEKDLGNPSYKVTCDTQGEGGSRKVTLAAEDEDVEISLGNIASAKFVLIKTNAKDPTLTLPEITIKLNSNTGEEISLAPLSGAKEAHMILSSSEITAIYATNPSTTVDVEVVVLEVGD
jgi:hypothetical protein